jgi:hypothetical protein
VNVKLVVHIMTTGTQRVKYIRPAFRPNDRLALYKNRDFIRFDNRN